MNDYSQLLSFIIIIIQIWLRFVRRPTIKQNITVKFTNLTEELLTYSTIKCDIIFWSGSHYNRDTFIMPKRFVRLIANVKQDIYCKAFFKKFGIGPLTCEFILEYLLVTKNRTVKFFRDLG